MPASNPFSGDTAPVRVLLARVIGYSSDGSIVRVRTQDERDLDTQAVSQLLNIGRDGDLIIGAGVDVAPEEGSLALVMRTTLGEWYTVGYVSPYDGPPKKFRVRRDQLNPGDISLTTRAGNALKILASGVADIRASALTGTTYFPDENLIHHRCRNYKINTLAGSLEWAIDSKKATGSAVWSVNSSDEEDSPQAIISLGHNSSGNLVQITTSRAPSSSFSINRQGVVRLDSAKDINLSSPQGNLRANGRMIYLNSSGTSGAKLPTKFPGNAVQIGAVTPSLSTPARNFPEFKAIPTSLPTPDPKKQLKSPTVPLPSSPLPRV